MHFYRRCVPVVAALAVGAATFASLPAGAQSTNPIEMRQKLMKQNGQAAKLGVQMLKGQQTYSPQKGEEVFTRMHDVAMKFGDYFPADSKTGHKTDAAPAIWQKPDAFKAALVKFQTDTAAAMQAKPQDLKAFGQQFGMVAKNCKSCHQEFRVDRG
ncbi:cytochrome c [Jiella sp. M17.18]|uniref:c-type cytochrome n=1 Tax=Jiella sp. M17.18 TaxID=3234247 RepID=UPI0034DE7E4A